MYRFFTFRLHDVPLPVTTYTKAHPEVRVVAYNAVREGDTPLPSENYYLVRAPSAKLPEIEALFREHLDVKRRIDSPEPGVMILQARFHFPGKGPLTGFLSVLTQAVGTILEFRPIIIQDGNLEVSLISLPRSDSQWRIRALEQYAEEKGLGFEMVENRALPMLPIVAPRQTIIDLMEWQVLQALDASGLYDADSPDALDPRFRDGVVAELAEALGLEADEVDHLRRRAEKKVVHEWAAARGRNIRLATPPPLLEPRGTPSEEPTS